MNTQTTTAAATPAAATEKKAKTTAEGMTAYRTFATPEEANAYLGKCAEDFADFTNQPFAMKAVDSATGEYDPAIYTDSMRVRVAVLKNRSKTEGEPSTVKAVVVGPVPTLDSLLSDDAGRNWVQKVIDKELNHIMVRPLREAENLDTAVAQMPTTRENFITSSREGGGLMEAFDNHYKAIGDAFASKFKAWDKQKRMLVKSELRKALESKAFALEYFPSLEDRGTDGEGNARPSLFVMALQFGSKLAASKGDDPAIFDKWLATRDAQTLAASTDDEDEGDEIGLDELTADFITEAPAAESTESGEAKTATEQEGEQAEGEAAAE